MKSEYINFLKDMENSVEYWTETTIVDFTEEICRVMKEKNITRRELATRLGTSQPYVTKVLRGNINFTLATMTKLARALGMIVRVHLAPDGVIVRWIEESPPSPVSQLNEDSSRKVVSITGSHGTYVFPPQSFDLTNSALRAV